MENLFGKNALHAPPTPPQKNLLVTLDLPNPKSSKSSLPNHQSVKPNPKVHRFLSIFVVCEVAPGLFVSLWCSWGRRAQKVMPDLRGDDPFLKDFRKRKKQFSNLGWWLWVSSGRRSGGCAFFGCCALQGRFISRDWFLIHGKSSARNEEFKDSLFCSWYYKLGGRFLYCKMVITRGVGVAEAVDNRDGELRLDSRSQGQYGKVSKDGFSHCESSMSWSLEMEMCYWNKFNKAGSRVIGFIGFLGQQVYVGLLAFVTRSKNDEFHLVVCNFVVNLLSMQSVCLSFHEHRFWGKMLVQLMEILDDPIDKYPPYPSYIYCSWWKIDDVKLFEWECPYMFLLVKCSNLEEFFSCYAMFAWGTWWLSVCTYLLELVDCRCGRVILFHSFNWSDDFEYRFSLWLSRNNFARKYTYSIYMVVFGYASLNKIPNCSWYYWQEKNIEGKVLTKADVWKIKQCRCLRIQIVYGRCIKKSRPHYQNSSYWWSKKGMECNESVGGYSGGVGKQFSCRIQRKRLFLGRVC